MKTVIVEMWYRKWNTYPNDPPPKNEDGSEQLLWVAKSCPGDIFGHGATAQQAFDRAVDGYRLLENAVESKCHDHAAQYEHYELISPDCYGVAFNWTRGPKPTEFIGRFILNPEIGAITL